MKKIILSILCAVALCGCTENTADIVCGDYRVSDMSFNSDGTIMHTVINDIPTDFYLAVSASGAKYDGIFDSSNMVLWSHGDTWTMFIDPDIAIECK